MKREKYKAFINLSIQFPEFGSHCFPVFSPHISSSIQIEDLTLSNEESTIFHEYFSLLISDTHREGQRSAGRGQHARSVRELRGSHWIQGAGSDSQEAPPVLHVQTGVHTGTDRAHRQVLPAVG